jgi:hypothetical protein
MKNIFESFLNFFESIGKARAATHLARSGRIEMAKQLMLKD